MKFGIFQILILALPLAAQPANVRSQQVSNTQALLTYTAPDSFPCVLEVSESPTYTPLVHDIDTGFFSGSNTDSRPGNISIGQARQFVVGKRDIEFANVGSNSGKYFSRALEANTLHYYRLTCTGGAATGTFTTATVAFGNTFGEPFQGDLANPGNAPYPYLDPTVRNSSYIDPQTGLRHTALTFASDYFSTYAAQPYTDAADMNGTTWSSPTSVYGMNSPTTATSGTGNLWIGVRNMLYGDFSTVGPSYDDLLMSGSNGSINYYQATIQGKVSSGTDTLTACLTVDRATCATSPATLNLTTSLQTLTIGTFSTAPNGSNGGNGADPVLFNANPPINRWHAYTHTGTVSADGNGNLAWVSGNYFDTYWGSSSFLRLSSVSSADACANGTAHGIASVTNGIALVTADMPAAATYFYCAGNFGVLIKRASPDSRTVTLENAAFNLSSSAGPLWVSTSDIRIVSTVQLNGGYYMVLAPSNGPVLLYFFNTATGTSTLIGPTKPNSNSSGADQWLYYQIPGAEDAPFDNTAAASTGHLVLYNAGQDVNGKQIIIRTDLSGAPAYQQNTINALMDQTGATITNPDAYSVQVVNHGMTAKFTNITPASLGKDLTTQMAAVPGFNPAFMLVSVAGVSNGYIYLQGRGNQNTISVFARLNPATGLIDNYTDTWSRPNCRWCPNHSGLQIQGDVNYVTFQSDPAASFPLGGDGSGPWIVTTNTAIAAAPGMACPANSVGAPTSGTACDVFTLNSHGGANPFEPYDPNPGPHESSDFLQAAQPGDVWCVSATNSCNYGVSERVILVAKNGAAWTVWRPCNLTAGGCAAIAGSGSKNFFAWCTGGGTALDANGINQGSYEGEPVWDPTTSGTNAAWYADLYFLGDHADAKYNLSVNGTNIPGQFVEVCAESIFCGIPGPDRPANGYRIRQGSLPGILTAPPNFSISTASFTGGTGNNNAGSHLSVGGLVSSFTDDRPFVGDALGITWSLVPGTNHVYVAGSAISLARKLLQTAAVAGPHVLRDISSPATGNQITDSTNFSYCVVLFANECRTGSSAGQVYVSASQRTYLGCYGGQSIIDMFAPGGNVQEDICVFPGGVNVNSIEQFSLTPDPVGWRYGRVLTYMTGKNKMDDAFANVRVMPDSTWAIGNERWGTTFRNEVVALKMPPLPRSTPNILDTLNRSAYMPVSVQVQGMPGADGVVADFGYAENGSDGASTFFCMSRQENCVANQASIGATPFWWASESFTPLACAEGAACTLVIPAVPDRVLYYRIRRTLSGVTVATETTQVQMTP